MCIYASGKRCLSSSLILFVCRTASRAGRTFNLIKCGSSLSLHFFSTELISKWESPINVITNNVVYEKVNKTFKQCNTYTKHKRKYITCEWHREAEAPINCQLGAHRCLLCMHALCFVFTGYDEIHTAIHIDRFIRINGIKINLRFE